MDHPSDRQITSDVSFPKDQSAAATCSVNDSAPNCVDISPFARRRTSAGVYNDIAFRMQITLELLAFAVFAQRFVASALRRPSDQLRSVRNNFPVDRSVPVATQISGGLRHDGATILSNM
jgi:hypothetical protein